MRVKTQRHHHSLRVEVDPGAEHEVVGCGGDATHPRPQHNLLPKRGCGIRVSHEPIRIRKRERCNGAGRGRRLGVLGDVAGGRQDKRHHPQLASARASRILAWSFGAPPKMRTVRAYAILCPTASRERHPPMTRAAVIGLGRIASTWDEERSKYDGWHLPHAHIGCMVAVPELEIVGLSDTWAEQRQAARAKWGIDASSRTTGRC